MDVFRRYYRAAPLPQARYLLSLTKVAAAGGTTTVTITAATMAYTGQAITVNAKKNIIAAFGTMTYTGQAIGVSKAVKASVGTMVYSAQAIAVTASKIIIRAMMTYGGQTIAVTQTSIHAISNSTMAYLGRDTIVNAATVAVTWLGNQLGLREKD